MTDHKEWTPPLLSFIYGMKSHLVEDGSNITPVKWLWFISTDEWLLVRKHFWSLHQHWWVATGQETLLKPSHPDLIVLKTAEISERNVASLNPSKSQMYSNYNQRYHCSYNCFSPCTTIPGVWTNIQFVEFATTIRWDMPPDCYQEPNGQQTLEWLVTCNMYKIAPER